MTSVALILDDAGAALVESMTINTLVAAAREFDGLDMKREPEKYRLARLELVTAAQVLAQLTGPRQTMNTPDPFGGGVRLLQGGGAVDSMPVEPPRCVHGVLFSEPCETCAANEPPAGSPPDVEPQMVGIEP